MITSLFKNNFFSYILTTIIGVIFWSLAFFEITLDIPVTVNIANQEFLFDRQTAIIFSFFITFIGAAILNFKLKKYLFSYEPTNLFLLFYVVINTLGLYSKHLITFSLVSLLLVLLVNYLFYFIENKKQEDQVFNSSFIIGLLVFHNLAFVILIPLLILNLGAVKRVSLKELGLILVGFLMPTIVVVLFTLLTDNYEILLSMFQWEINTPQIPWKYSLYFLSLFFISIKGYRLVVTKRSGIDINIIRLTKNMFMFFVSMTLIVALSLFVFPKEYVAFITAIPLSIFLSDFFANSSHRFKEIIFLVVISFPFWIRFIN